jgi:outer membrane lipoprotein SlyB
LFHRSQIGNGNGRTAATAIGAVVGGVISSGM